MFYPLMSTKEFSKKAIIKQMEKVCLSSELVNKTILCSLLEYLIAETLAGREERLKGYTIGVEALGKEEGFDPDKDPLVRIHAGRLRRALRLYYLETGKNDAIRIEIPKGQYAPDFIANADNTVEENNFQPKNNQPNTEPSVAVIPFKNISGDPDKDYFGVGFAEELSIELTKYEDLTVYESVQFSANQISGVEIHSYLKKKGIRFIVEGSVQLAVKNIKVLVRLIDNKKGKQIWAEKYLRELSGHNLNEILENIISEISSVLGSEYGIIIQRLTGELTHAKPQKLDTFYAISRFHYFEACQTIDAAHEAFSSLEHAISKDPNSGIAHAMLASLYGNRYLLDFPNANNAYKRMILLADKALSLDPNSLFVRCIFAAVCFASNKKDRFFQEVEICLSQNPRLSMRLGVLGFYLALYGDWERGKEILDRVMKINISFPVHYYGVTALYYYRKYEYENAHEELKKYNSTTLFWAPMQRIAIYGQLNRLDEAKPDFALLKQLKPDFEEKAEYLLSRFIKEADLLALMLEGLRKAGMNV
jgi:TolB-like protein/Tfp pilus assembly protein PilF